MMCDLGVMVTFPKGSINNFWLVSDDVVLRREELGIWVW